MTNDIIVYNGKYHVVPNSMSNIIAQKVCTYYIIKLIWSEINKSADSNNILPPLIKVNNGLKVKG